MFDAATANPQFANILNVTSAEGAVDLTTKFTQTNNPACAGINLPIATLKYPCELKGDCLNITELFKARGGQYWLNPIQLTTASGKTISPAVSYNMQQVKKRGLVLLKKQVLDFGPYLQSVKPDSNDPIDVLIRQTVASSDATKYFYAPNSPISTQLMQCLAQKYPAGVISTLDPGCLIAQTLLAISTIIILLIVLVKFFTALVFTWFISKKISKEPESFSSSSSTLVDQSSTKPHVVFLVTCYSEGKESIKATLDSLARTDYPDHKKLLFIVADGWITGKGNSKSTPDIVREMIQLVKQHVVPASYVAVATGSKKHNMAQVFAGYYQSEQHSVPCVLVVKCGTPSEANTPKPGNRGKRDSQLILMNFFKRVTLNDYMTPLDYELFNKIQLVSKVTPDHYELCAMVDADTKVHVKSLKYMVNTMVNDHKVVGLCGETQIENKHESFCTMIQVFEYYISHHLSKAFESAFDVVTCLPGCFCMYRIKVRQDSTSYKSAKQETWIPLLVNPEIVDVYATDGVDSLHQKNLLLLGEDRFLSTLMIKQFPKRKMVFVPQATCKTVVPADFKTLTSQRRRWINSTFHNLLELVLVRNLCGTFCFSMQFVVLMDLIGTSALPASLALTIYLIVASCMSKLKDLFDIIPLAMLGLIMFLPAILVLLKNFGIDKLYWMLWYFIALPYWNFILPLYSFWRFDDFSWGATRQVQGIEKDSGHLAENDEFDQSEIPLKRWETYESERKHFTELYQEQTEQALMGDQGSHPSLMNPEEFRQSVLVRTLEDAVERSLRNSFSSY